MSGPTTGDINGFEINSFPLLSSGGIVALPLETSEVQSITLLAGWNVAATPIGPTSMGVEQTAVDGPTSATVFGLPFTSSLSLNIGVQHDGVLNFGMEPWASSFMPNALVGHDAGVVTILGGINAYNVGGFPINGEAHILIYNPFAYATLLSSSEVVMSVMLEERFLELECLIIDYVPAEDRLTVVPGRQSTICH